MSVPREFLQRFLLDCTEELNKHTLVEPQPLSEIRQYTLHLQRSCLERAVDKWNDENIGRDNETKITTEQVQLELRNLQQQSADESSNDSEQLKFHKELSDLNEAARQAFCRLVLYSECLYEQEKDKRSLQMTDSIERADLLEFCGLCLTVLRLPNVQQHLRDGSDLFENVPVADSEKTILPQKRLEHIQRQFFCALGYDPDHGTAEIKRIFFTTNNNNEYADDEQVLDAFAQLTSATRTALHNATIHAQEMAFSDQEEGGVTRVVSVSYSEKLVDARTGQQVVTGTDVDAAATAVPTGERMEEQAEAQQRENLHLAREAAALQKEILDELLALCDEERQARLATAKEASENFMKQALEIPSGAERVAFLRSVDPDTQRLMVMHKLWEGMVAANGGKEPNVHLQEGTNS